MGKQLCYPTDPLSLGLVLNTMNLKCLQKIQVESSKKTLEIFVQISEKKVSVKDLGIHLCVSII